MKRIKKLRIVPLVLLLLMGLPKVNINTLRAQAPGDDEQNRIKFVPGRVLVKFRQQTQTFRKREILSGFGARKVGEISGIGVQVVRLPEGASETDFVQAFKAMPDVEFAELDQVLSPEDVTPNDPWFPSEWHLTKIAAPAAWSMTTGSNSVIVAICDTGVDSTHPDLASKMVPGRNVYNNNSDTSDVYGHGTKVAGTAAASSNNQTGVAAISWGALIMPVRVSDTSGNATFSAIANGINWAADHGARVANVSYIATNSSTVRSAAQYMQSKGGVVTMSAGNYSTFDSSPDNPYVLTVSATNTVDAVSDFSNTGNNIDVAAPEGAYTTTRGGGYAYVGGTSFSAPIVAGVAALVLSVNPNLTANQVQDILKQSADDLGPAGWDSGYGWGRVNAARAVSLASGGGAPDTTPPTVNFTSPAAGAAVSGTVSVQVTAGDNVGVASVNLSMDGVLIGGDSSAPYTFSWNTTTVANGTHTLTATALDAAGNTANAALSVNVTNTPPDTTPPIVVITSPSAGATVSGNISVLVAASDNVRVVKVDLYVDGALTDSATSAPFTTRWNARRASGGAHTLQCKAYDAAGNVRLSSTVTVYR